MLGGSEQEADVCRLCRRQATNKQTSTVSECLYCGCINDPDDAECLPASPFQWRAVLPKVRPELSKYRDYIVNRVKGKINISK